MRPPAVSDERTDQFVKKGTWSPEEDALLVKYIRKYGIWNWSLMPQAAGLRRTGKSCRLRWMNYLKPNIRRGNYSKEEEDTIVKLHQILGNKWSAIAERLPGRTDNDVKNYWHTHLKKRIKKHQELQKKGPMQGMETIKPETGREKCDKSLQKDDQVPALPGSIPAASDPGSSCLITSGSASSSLVSSDVDDPPRGLWGDQTNSYSMEGFFMEEENSWSSYNDYDLWFEGSATYSYTSDEGLARDFWDGLFSHYMMN